MGVSRDSGKLNWQVPGLTGTESGVHRAGAVWAVLVVPFVVVVAYLWTQEEFTLAFVIAD